MTDLPRVTIYTDGGCDPNPGPGGWAALLIDGRTSAIRELSDAEYDTTNNRMELTAAIEALNALTEPCVVTLYTDSEYLKNGITRWLRSWKVRGWMTSKDEPVKNGDLWRDLDAARQRHQVDWNWVKGHAGNEFNERVDQLATAARLALTGDSVPLQSTTPTQAAPSDISPDYEIALRVSVPKNGGPGGYAFRVARLADDNLGTLTTDRVPSITSNRLLLQAALDALQTVPYGTPVRVFCPDDYLYKGMTQWISGWQRNGWRNSSKKPVEHRDLWEALLEEQAARPILWTAEPKSPRPALARGLEKLAADAVKG